MQEPIKSGDRCLVIAGVLGDKGPNVGKTVTVGTLRGQHSEYGNIWRCHGPDIVSEYGAVGNEGDFAQSWLKKLPPDQTPPKVVEREKEVTE